MTSRIHGVRFVFTGLAAALLALACSGGGSSGGSDAAAITEDDAEAIAGAVLLAGFLAGDVTDVVEAGVDDDAGAARLGGAVPGRDVPTFTTRAPFGPSDVDCDVDGFVTLSGDVQNPGSYQTGDEVDALFVMCDDDNGFVFDGGFDFTITSLSGDLLGDDYDVTLDALFTDFEADDGLSPIDLDGDLVWEGDLSAPPLASYAASGTALDLAFGGDTYQLFDYDADLVIDEGEDPEEYTTSADGRMRSSAFDGEVTYQTTQDFMGTGTDPPASGELVITGAFDATITVAPVDAVDVDLFLDLDGSGSTDALVETTWSALGF
ncbi:MAG: hypothetical protein ACQGVC_13490 [Myxococcota bacterium]